MALTISLSLVAAALFALAAVLQQRGTKTIDDRDALGVSMLESLIHRRVWLAGMATDIAAFGMQAWALASGGLLLVQPLLVTALLFALPLGAWSDRRRLAPPEWAWAGVLVASLVGFLLIGQPTAGIDTPSFGSWIPVIVVCAPIVIGCIATARPLAHGTRRSLLIAIAAGLLLGLSAPLTKGAIAGFDGGFVAGVTSWELWGMALTASLGTFWQQSSYQAGDVQTSLPAVTVLKPVVAMALGLTVYQEHLAVGGPSVLVLAVALVGMVAATVGLSRLAAPALQDTTSVAT